MTLAPLAIVVAVAKNGVIGKDGGLPWHHPEDLKHFKNVTTGHAIIMGRNTYASIGRPLPNRRNIVVSRNREFNAAGCDVVATLEEAIRVARRTDAEPRVIGGAQLYEAALPLVTSIYYTEVDEAPDGDVHFPSFDRASFVEESLQPAADPALRFLLLRRRTHVDATVARPRE